MSPGDVLAFTRRALLAGSYVEKLGIVLAAYPKKLCKASVTVKGFGDVREKSTKA